MGENCKMTKGVKCNKSGLYRFVPPIADENEFGGIKASPKTTEDKEIFIDPDTGKLYTDSAADAEIAEARENSLTIPFSSLQERLVYDFEYLYGLIKTPREYINLEGSQNVELNFDYLKPNGGEYCYTGGTIKSIHFGTIKEDSTTSIEMWDYWCLFILPKASSISAISDLLLNTQDEICVLNPDLDLSGYTTVHLLFTFDGTHVCCVVAGY